ncbi:MAG: tRNA pseudouridine(13) synthase TruD [Silanimonas sp.]
MSPFGPALFSARIKAAPEDFVVEEIAAEPASGQGEHLHLWVEKRGLATTDVVQRLCRWVNLAPVAIGYAGLKDKQAVTRQRFTVHLPKRVAPDLAALESDGLRVIEHTWHARKLPRGGLAGNAFTITLRELRGPEGEVPGDALRVAIDSRLQAIAERGVPNRFGVQRFGRFGDNVGQARRMFAGAKVGRETRSMLLSAARSELFNRVLDARVADGSWERGIDGEVFMLDGRKSVFGPEPLTPDLETRIAAFDVHPTGPLWGRGTLRTTGAALALEAAIAGDEAALCKGLEEAGLSQERRALRVRAEGFAWSWPQPDVLELRFRLPPGCYATAVLAGLCGESGEGAGDALPDGD